jgi:hypothetical protein
MAAALLLLYRPNICRDGCRDSIGYLSLTITIKVQSTREIIYSATSDNVLDVTYLKCPI